HPRIFRAPKLVPCDRLLPSTLRHDRGGSGIQFAASQKPRYIFDDRCRTAGRRRPAHGRTTGGGGGYKPMYRRNPCSLRSAVHRSESFERVLGGVCKRSIKPIL